MTAQRSTPGPGIHIDGLTSGRPGPGSDPGRRRWGPAYWRIFAGLIILLPVTPLIGYGIGEAIHDVGRDQSGSAIVAFCRSAEECNQPVTP